MRFARISVTQKEGKKYNMINKNGKLFIAGHQGMVGSSLIRKFTSEGFTNIITRSSAGLDLRRQTDVENFFEFERPEYVIVAAAKVGGILANNTYRAEFIYDNLMIETNIIHSAYKSGCKKLIFLGSSCIYPKNAPQPLKEEYLLSGYLEETNEPYAIAKIAGIKLCESYFKQYGNNFYSVMPTNMYGPNDNFNLNTSHVLPAMIRKFHEAKKQSAIRNQEPVDREIGDTSMTHSPVTLWGTGTPRREFMYVDDLADALYYLLEKVEAKDIYELGITHLNIGTSEDLTLKDLALLTQEIIDHHGSIEWDESKPDGMMKKRLDVTIINNLGWKAKTSLNEGIWKTYQYYKCNLTNTF